ncbi:MAG: type III pantothenate kinase [bacterium]
MILVFDIGNTEIDFALFAKSNKEPKYHSSIKLGIARIDREILSFLSRYNIKISQIQAVVIGSVVPKETKRITRICYTLFKLKPFIAISGKNTIIPMKYRPMSSIGVDRVANAVGAIAYYKKLPVIVVDLGTATTFTVVSHKGKLIGGAITIGIQTAIQALHQETAQLPAVDLSNTTIKSLPVIGNSTVLNLQSGFYFGFIELIDGMVNRLRKELKQKPLIIATGGLSQLIAPASKTIQKVDPLLTLKGLYIIYQKQK